MSKVTFSAVNTYKGSNQRSVNVERNGYPFGQIWTFRNTKTETSPWTAKTLSGEFKHFYKADGGLKAAKVWMEKKAA